MSNEDLNALVDHRLAQAQEALQDAKLLLDAGRHRAAANRMYYASFYGALAALLTKGLQYSKHSATIASFDRELIKPRILPREYSKALHRAFHERQQDDYLPFADIDPAELRQLFADVEMMVNGVHEYVRRPS